MKGLGVAASVVLFPVQSLRAVITSLEEGDRARGWDAMACLRSHIWPAAIHAGLRPMWIPLHSLDHCATPEWSNNLRNRIGSLSFQVGILPFSLLPQAVPTYSGSVCSAQQEANAFPGEGCLLSSGQHGVTALSVGCCFLLDTIAQLSGHQQGKRSTI